MSYILENLDKILPLLVFIVGWLLPSPKFRDLGKEVREKTGDTIAEELGKRLDAFAQGLLDKKTEGRKDLIHNDDLRNEFQKVKIDLGLED